jgi:hypothetical protein
MCLCLVLLGYLGRECFKGLHMSFLKLHFLYKNEVLWKKSFKNFNYELLNGRKMTLIHFLFKKIPQKLVF